MQFRGGPIEKYVNTLVNHTIAALINVVFLNLSDPRPTLGHRLCFATPEETQIKIYEKYKTLFDVPNVPFFYLMQRR